MVVENSVASEKIPLRSLRALSEFEPVTSLILSLVAKDTRFRCQPGLDRVLAENKRLVVVVSHASPLSWIPAIGLLTAHAVARGGGPRAPIGVVDRFFYSVPGLQQIAGYISQSDKPLGFQELVQHFGSLELADLIVFPEGSNCFFGDPNELQPFRSRRFVELSIRTKTPMLLCVHKGSETWGKTVALDAEKVNKLPLPDFVQKFLGERLKQSGLLTLPLPPIPMPLFTMNCALYQPETAFLSEDPEQCRTQVGAEAEKVYERMKSLMDEIENSQESLAELS